MTKVDKPVDIVNPSTGQVLAWEAPEFFQHSKGFIWMVIVWLVAFALAALALWSYRLSFSGVLAGIVPLAAALALTTQGRLKPDTVRIALDDAGVTVKGQLYSWSELKSFWLVFSEISQVLYLETTRPLFSVVSIQLAKMDPDTVRTYLLNHLPERSDRAEEFGDRLARIIKF